MFSADKEEDRVQNCLSCIRRRKEEKIIASFRREEPNILLLPIAHGFFPEKGVLCWRVPFLFCTYVYPDCARGGGRIN